MNTLARKDQILRYEGEELNMYSQYEYDVTHEEALVIHVTD